MSDRIRVLIVEDSKVVREYLKYLIDQDPRLEVVAAVESGEEALQVLEKVRPDVVSMDIRLPGMNGFEVTQRIMSTRPTPIVVVSASLEAADLQITMNALRAGALSVIEKPVGTTHHDYQTLASKLCTQLAIMSRVKVVRQRAGRQVHFNGQRSLPALPAQPTSRAGKYEMLGVVASTGGPNALVQLFNGLGAGFSLPVLLVQHITASFLEGFAEWLKNICPLQVSIASSGRVPEPGTIYLAPADHHLLLRDRVLRAERSDMVSAQRPSGTVLFESMARALGPGALGVLLTGMGEDGARGLLEVRRAGGYTLAEDESTAVVYGMPRAAVALGAACEVLPLGQIAARIVELTGKTKAVG